MSLLLAPYNNAMRLGQGFNSYIQQICIDDAVVIKKDQAPNIVNNAGDTMEKLVKATVEADRARDAKAKFGQTQDAKAIEQTHTPGNDSGSEPEMIEHTDAPRLIDSHAKAIDSAHPPETESQAEKELTPEEKRKKEGEEAAKAATHSGSWSKEEMAERAARTKVDISGRPTGLGTNTKQYEWSMTEAKGAAQVVTYASRFVDKLSDITDDMNISGGLSIKYGTIGGSGRGSFIDSDKFKQSDLNFYISVKVINQTMNWWDVLQFNSIPSITATSPKDPTEWQKRFTEVFGDTFISGFLEGGEFNAVVSMKILNKAKVTDIEAEAKVALTVGPVDVKAEGKVQTAKKNIEANTETTIQVSWSGGGHIKDPRQAWTIDSLMEAAARFPDLVAQSPQRTYAILSKYGTLRSFAEQKPAETSPLAYENAQMYTNAMMDTFMEYKTIYKKITSDIFAVKDSKTKRIVPWPDSVDTSDTGETKNFDASVKGLEDARKAIRKQMSKIVAEVDHVTKDPAKLTPEYIEPFIPSGTLSSRLPVVDDIVKPPEVPLSGKEIQPDHTQDRGKHGDLLAMGEGDYTEDERSKVNDLMKRDPSIGDHLKLTEPCGSKTKGASFNNLDFIQKDFVLSSISIHTAEGAITAVTSRYTNGLIVQKGRPNSNPPIELPKLTKGERIISASIETGKGPNEGDEERVLSVRIWTNRGHSLLGQAPDRSSMPFKALKTTYFDSPFQTGSLRGFWGRCNDDGTPTESIWRLGLIWGDAAPSEETGNIVERHTVGSDSVFAQSGDTMFTWGDRTTAELHAEKRYPIPYSRKPRVITGIRHIDLLDNLPSASFTEYSDTVSETGFSQHAGIPALTSEGKASWAMGISYLVLPENEVLFQNGEVSLSDLDRNPPKDYPKNSFRVMFPRKFASEPRVVCWFKGASFAKQDAKTKLRVKCSTRSATTDGVTIIVETWWTETILQGATVGWLAWDLKSGDKVARTFDLVTCTEKEVPGAPPDQKDRKKTLTFDPPFQENPEIFVALREFEIWNTKPIRAEVKAISRNKNTAVVELGTWYDTDFRHMCATLVAIEGHPN